MNQTILQEKIIYYNEKKDLLQKIQKKKLLQEIELLHEAAIHQEKIELLGFILDKKYIERINRIKELKSYLQDSFNESMKISKQKEEIFFYKGYWNDLEKQIERANKIQDFEWETIENLLANYQFFIELCKRLIPNSLQILELEATTRWVDIENDREKILKAEDRVKRLNEEFLKQKEESIRLLKKYTLLKKDTFELIDEVSTYSNNPTDCKLLKKTYDKLKTILEELIQGIQPNDKGLILAKTDYENKHLQIISRFLNIYTQHNKLLIEVQREIINKKQILSQKQYLYLKEKQELIQELENYKNRLKQLKNQMIDEEIIVSVEFLQEKMNYHQNKIHVIKQKMYSINPSNHLECSAKQIQEQLKSLYHQN